MNPWINYALPIHRMRENGFSDRIFDLIDERSLTRSEIRQFCLLVFGHDNFENVPDPNEDWLGFLDEIDRLNTLEQNTYNPITKRVCPYIDTAMLHKKYGDGGGCQWLFDDDPYELSVLKWLILIASGFVEIYT